MRIQLSPFRKYLPKTRSGDRKVELDSQNLKVGRNVDITDYVVNSPRGCRNTFCKNLSQVIKLQGEAAPHLARHLIPFTKAINAQLIIKWIEVNTGANSAHGCAAAICHGSLT